ncbi:peptidoglycan editing factor PgeF [Tropicimonas sp. TH_r6]|uniref:peptidoglycan editing factor PgeF n=1 Tax=Tropicimonas sp. TH_r6 TaxID=3082085 RepID=UPI0029537B75|nr:peptidoglycan editing factor PgeF [Tropicimonas sp. TH_r6]MDV7142242.1 peptidoglycan editing factor PgeF [Tropicimonas sp. TH_r6]
MTLEILTSEILSPLRHGFFTRRGGASSGVFEGLNCGPGSSDQSEIVAINRDRVATSLGVTSAELISMNQVHSAEVEVVEATPTEAPRVDSIVTDRPGLALSVLTADCQPVLFADHSAGVIGAAHAGWRGALSGVLEATLDRMEKLGAHRSDTVAVIGPCISQSAYEVGREFYEEFIAQEPGNQRFFTRDDGEKLQFDLPAFGLHRMRRAGIGQATWTRHCTYSDPERFFSYRRTTHRKEADYGRLIAAIRL